MIELLKGYLDLGWRTKTEILEYLESKGCRTDERTFRERKKRYNKGIRDGQATYIASGPKGYLLTADLNVIRRTRDDFKKRALDLLGEVSLMNRMLKEEGQITMLPEEQKLLDAYEVLMKVDHA